MVAKILQPVFKCAEDETIFFSRLAEVRGCQKVVSKDLNVYLTIGQQTAKTASNEIQAICDIWYTSFKVYDVEEL